MTAMCKNMMKRTGAHGATSAIHCSAIAVGKSTAISKIVDFIGAEPFGSALFLPSPRIILSGSHRVILSGSHRVILSGSHRVILSGAKDLAFID